MRVKKRKKRVIMKNLNLFRVANCTKINVNQYLRVRRMVRICTTALKGTGIKEKCLQKGV